MSKWSKFTEGGSSEGNAEQSFRQRTSFPVNRKVSLAERMDSLDNVERGLAALDKLIKGGKESDDNSTAGGLIQECRSAVASHPAMAATVQNTNAAQASAGMGLGSSASGNDETEK